jgi:hypothetical protein
MAVIPVQLEKPGPRYLSGASAKSSDGALVHKSGGFGNRFV